MSEKELTVTPNLQQAIRLLGCSHRELLDLIADEINANRALRRGAERATGRREPDVVLSEVEGQITVQIAEHGSFDISPRAPEKARAKAAFFTGSLEQRAALLKAVVECLVEVQGAFLRGEIPERTPIEYEALADRVGIDPFAARRVLAGKQFSWRGEVRPLVFLRGAR